MATDISAELPAPVRLAAGYAPARARGLWTALLTLDERLARAALGATDPMIGQLRLAWWRDRLREPASDWPAGEPLLAALRAWEAERGVLEGLVDGWERTIGGDPSDDERARCVAARTDAVVALSRLLGCEGAEVAPAARDWAQADLALRLGEGADARLPLRRLPRAMRPLAILAELAGRPAGSGLRRFARIVRLGMIGR